MWTEASNNLKQSGEGEYIMSYEKLTAENDSDTPNAKMVLEILQTQLADAPEKKGNRRAARILDKTISFTVKFAAVADVAVSYDPGSAALPWAAVRFVLLVSSSAAMMRTSSGPYKTLVPSLLQPLTDFCKELGRI